MAGRRFAARTEAAAYFCCTAAVPDATWTARVSLAVADDELVIEIAGAAQTDADLAAMVDRVEALGGSLQLPDDPRTATDRLLVVRLPVDADVPAPLLRGSA